MHALSSAGDPPVLILGGTGFLGRALVRRLLQDGARVRVLVRNASDRAELLARHGAELVQGDTTDTASLAAALAGVREVYHLARGQGPAWEDYRRSDVEPTRQLAELCVAQGAVLYYTSSIAVYDGGRAGQVIDEATPPSRACLRLNLYARAKAESEALLSALHHARGLQVVVFRPGIVIGDGGPPQHPGVGAWPEPATCRPWGGGHYRLPFVLVDDCADAMVRARHVPGIAGTSFNLVGDADLTGSAYLDALAQAAGAPIRRRPLPAAQLFAQSVVKWGLKWLRAAPERPLPSYRYCDSFSRRASYSNERARRQLAWAPEADPARLIERGIVAAVAGARA